MVADFAAGSGPLPHRVLSRIVGLFGQRRGRSHGQARPLAELMSEAGFLDAALSPRDDRHIEFTIATRNG